MGHCDKFRSWIFVWQGAVGPSSRFVSLGCLSRDQTMGRRRIAAGMSVVQPPSGSGTAVVGVRMRLAEAVRYTHYRVHHRDLFLLFFFSLLLSLFLLLCLCVPPASSHSLIVASHAVYALAGLCEDKLLYLSGAGTAGKACGMVRFVACEK